MKNFLATAICALFVLTASAQRAGTGNFFSNFSNKSFDESSSAQFGIRVGMNASNIKWEDGGVTGKYSSHIGYHIGFIVDVPLYKNFFYIQPGVYLTQKGAKEKYSSNSSYSADPSYLEFPILFSGRYTLGIAQLMVNFGPYFACGLFGNAKDKYRGETEKWKLFSEDGEDWKRFDAGLSIGAGVLLTHHYYIGFQYEIGLANFYDDWGGDDKLKNRTFMLSIGYNF